MVLIPYRGGLRVRYRHPIDANSDGPLQVSQQRRPTLNPKPDAGGERWDRHRGKVQQALLDHAADEGLGPSLKILGLVAARIRLLGNGHTEERADLLPAQSVLCSASALRLESRIGSTYLA